MAVPTTWRDEIELERRLVHAIGTAYPVPYLLGWLSWSETVAALGVSVAIAGGLELLRLVVGLDHAVYRALIREYETDTVAGYAVYQVGMAGAALLGATSVATPALAVAAMWMLSLGDPISGALGTNGPRERKRPLVWAAMFTVCVAIAFPTVLSALGTRVSAVTAVAGAAAATVADGLPPVIRGVTVDDNLTIPLGAVVSMAAVVALVS